MRSSIKILSTLGISKGHLDNFGGQRSRFLDFSIFALELFIGSVKALFPDLKSLLMGIISALKVPE